jgi:hypothetical protein
MEGYIPYYILPCIFVKSYDLRLSDVSTRGPFAVHASDSAQTIRRPTPLHVFNLKVC